MDLPDRTVCYRALESRDVRFDGLMFVGVSSTGIYCRPICPARIPKFEHCSFYRQLQPPRRRAIGHAFVAVRKLPLSLPRGEALPIRSLALLRSSPKVLSTDRKTAWRSWRSK